MTVGPQSKGLSPGWAPNRRRPTEIAAWEEGGAGRRLVKGIKQSVAQIMVHQAWTNDKQQLAKKKVRAAPSKRQLLDDT